MNIFVTDSNPVIAARNLCDKHISKMIVESAQMLSTAWWTLDGGCPGSIVYKPTHQHHPCTKWVMESDGNYLWLGQHALEMCNEYTRRYGRTHKTQCLIQCLWSNSPRNIPNRGKRIMTDFAHAYYGKDPVGHLMCHVPGDPVQSYRNFYKLDKARFAKWNHSDEPSWWSNK
jgi:Pyrimidine dimer DNA glycosylase